MTESDKPARCVPFSLPAIAIPPAQGRTFWKRVADGPSCTFLPILGILLVMGCSEPQRGPQLFPVTGSVTYNGEPVEGATLVFVPQDHSYSAVATSDAGGKFRVRTHQANPDDGAAVGNYKVAIRKNYMTPEDKEIWLLPRSYGSFDKPAFTEVVMADENNECLFELVDD